MSIICELPYRCANINEEGEVFPCCGSYCSDYSFGNILKEEFSQIWNGQRAQQFRKQFLNNEYKYCNLKICLPHRSNEEITESEISDRRPASVLLGYDRTCNVRCIFCTPPPQPKLHLNKFDNIENWCHDLFKDVEHVNVSCSGELFASEHARKLVKRISQLYPDIKFDILTNGLLFDKENLLDLCIEDKLSQVGISFHTLNKNVYSKLVHKSDFDRVMKNVQYAINLKKNNKIETLEFRFVITSWNYKEMIAFANFAKENEARAVFMDCIQYNMPDKLYNILNISNPLHPEYNNFTRLIKNPIFREDFVNINPKLLQIKPINFITKIRNKLINSLFHNS